MNLPPARATRPRLSASASSDATLSASMPTISAMSFGLACFFIASPWRARCMSLISGNHLFTCFCAGLPSRDDPVADGSPENLVGRTLRQFGPYLDALGAFVIGEARPCMIKQGSRVDARPGRGGGTDSIAPAPRGE